MFVAQELIFFQLLQPISDNKTQWSHCVIQLTGTVQLTADTFTWL